MCVSFLPIGAQAALVDGSDYITQQVYLGDSLQLHLQGNVDYLFAESAVATVTYCDQVHTYRLEDLAVCQDGKREIVIDLAAAQMTEDVALKIQVGNVVVLEETYSVRDYLTSLIDGNYTKETKQLSYELLNYGAWAQKYFQYNPDALANEDYETTAGNAIPPESSGIRVLGDVPGIQYYGASLRLLSKLAVRYYFKASAGVGDYTFTVDGVKYTPESKDGLYYIEVPCVAPQNMDAKMDLEVTDGSNTLSFAYAATDFFIRSYHNATDETYQSLLTAAYSYFMAAKRFANVENMGELSFTYKTGDSKTIQLATNLPADTALSDFTLNENGCLVNESANQYQKASKVTMSNVDGQVLLSFCFDSDFAADQTYTLPKNAVFCFTDNSQYALDRDYLFRFDGTAWTQVEAAGDFRNGVDMETPGNVLLFTGQGRSYQDATISTVAYSGLGISKPSGGGSYALKLSHTDSGEHTFRIQFGREMAAGSKLTFMVCSKLSGSSIGLTQDKSTEVSLFGKVWKAMELVLPEDMSYVDMSCSFNQADGEMYLDNFLVTEPAEAANLLLGFESYDQLTGAKIAVGNKLGRMQINTDIRYITQGDGSLMVSPQGDYTKAGEHPFFKLDLLDTTFNFNDFSNLKSISFDVYNAEDETLHIGVGLVAGESMESYLTTISQSFTLAPNSWTTCDYDLSVMAGYNFYDLSNVRYMTFSFLEHKESREDTPNVLYLDNLHANVYADGEGPAEPSYDYQTGITFEEPGQEFLFTGQGIKNRDAEIERIQYYNSGTVAAPAGGGSYGLRLRHGSNYWPTFRIHFGQVLSAGTEITFQAYGKILDGTSLYNQSIFEFSSGGEATAQFNCDQWQQLVMVLPEDAEYVDLFWNYERAGITSSTASGEVYIDNIKIAEYEPTGDILEGYGFEEKGNAERFTGQGDSANDATIKRFTYAALGIDAPSGDCGEYALKLTHDSSQTPTFRINFGKELPAGTTISFMAYTKLKSGYVYPQKNVIKYSDGTNATDSFNFKVWKNLTVTLSEDAEYIDLTWSFKGTFGTAVCELYIDNIKAVSPAIDATGDILEGIGFEEIGNAEYFTGIGVEQDATVERATYADLGIAAPENGGDYALKLSHSSHYYPTFQLSFGKILPAGTVITFQAYGAFDGCQSTNEINIEFTGDSGSGDVLWARPETWSKVTITLSSDCNHLQFFWNIERGNSISGDVASYILIDNVKAQEPVQVDDGFAQGLDFEVAEDAQYFVGQGKTQDATIERVTYAASGITGPTDGGSYALKLSHASNYWPTFRISFGKTLKAGTTITFMAYGKITSGTNLYNQSIFEYSAGGEATAQFKCDQWTELTITLQSDAEYIDLFWNYDRATITSATASGAVYLDNFQVTEA